MAPLETRTHSLGRPMTQPNARTHTKKKDTRHHAIRPFAHHETEK